MIWIANFALHFLYATYDFIEYFIDMLNYRLFGLGDLEEEPVAGKVALVTGSNTGLGKEIVRELAERGATVILACRNLKAGAQAVSDIKKEVPSAKLEIMKLDLSDLGSVRKFANEVKNRYPQLHLLVNNAGVCSYNKELQTTKDGFELHMGVNHLGHFLLTNLLLDNLKAGAPGRVVVISSSTVLASKLRLNDLMMETFKQPCMFTGISRLPYNNSKMANALFAKELGRRLEDTGITVYSLCPGIVETEVFRDSMRLDNLITSALVGVSGITTKQAMKGVMYCALSRKCEHETGKWYRFGNVHRRANRMMTVKDAQDLWNTSERMVKNRN